MLQPPSSLGATRTLAIKRSKRKAPQKASLPTVQANETLVKAIMQKTNGAASATEVQVRLVPDPLLPNDAPKPPTVVVSLHEAIQKAITEQADLVEIAINQEVPVVTVSSLESLTYQAEKMGKKKTQTASVLKETQFRVGIAENDMERKVDAVVKFLNKGHNVQIIVKAPRRYAIRDPEAASNMTNRILELLLEDAAELVRDPVMNETNTQAKFLVRPKK